MHIRQNTALGLALNQKTQNFFSILQMSYLELKQTLETALEENPFLEEEKKVKYDTELPEISFQPSVFTLLEKQIWEVFTNNKEYQLAKSLLYDLDERGFFSSSFDVLQKKLSLSESTLQNVITTLQTLSPAGIFAFSLQSSLILQAKRHNWEPQYINILQEDFALLSEGNIRLLKKKHTKSTIEEFKKLFKRLSLHPLRSIVPFTPCWIIADFFIEKTNLSWQAHSNDIFLPTLILNPFYEKIVIKNPEEKKQCSEWKEKAKQLLFCLKKRKQLIYKILKFIIPLQADYLENTGPLKPCSLGMIAEKLHLHPTTIWRAISEKMISTPIGTISLSSLITSNPASKEAKQLLLHLLSEKTTKNPLSDKQIASELEKKGIFLARRTIAKYRKLLLIPSSQKR